MQSMNMGFREGADLADMLTQILRKDRSKEYLKSYDRGHWLEWWRLLGFKNGSAAADGAPEWVRLRAAQIVGSIPASGADLTRLLKQLGIDFQPTASQKAQAA